MLLQIVLVLFLKVFHHIGNLLVGAASRADPFACRLFGFPGLSIMATTRSDKMPRIIVHIVAGAHKATSPHKALRVVH